MKLSGILILPALIGASIRPCSGLRDLQDRVSTLRVLAKMVALEGFAPSRAMALVSKTSVSSKFHHRAIRKKHAGKDLHPHLTVLEAVALR